ncbi:MAG: hypothetical protein RIR37_918, partial [Verrucomicrobiota bacterium]
AHVQMVRWVTGSAMDSGAPGPHSLSEADVSEFWELAVPYALAPLVISVLLGQRLGIVVSIFASLFGSMLRGGIDAWSREVDPKVPRYRLEMDDGV